MPKVKTHQALAKRIKRTGTGKIQRRAAFISHLQGKKSPSRKRRHAGYFTVTSGYRKRIKKLVPY